MGGFIPVPGGELYYEVQGSGHPLVLVHAGVADHRQWDAQMPVFAERYRVIRYDTRGFGRSRNDATPFSNRADLYAVLAHLAVERAYVLGVSRAGQIVTDFTLEHPEKVAALIPVAAGLSGYEFQPSPESAAELEAFTQMDKLWEARDLAALAELEVKMWVDGPRQPAGRADAAVRERVREMVLANYSRTDPEPPAQPLTPPAAGRLGEIHVPTLVIVGEHDTHGTLLMADALAAGIPGARKVLMPGVAHMPNMEQPEEFNRLVLDFLQTVAEG